MNGTAIDMQTVFKELVTAEVVQGEAGYKGESQWLIEELNAKNYIGLPLLTWMDLCTAEDFPVMKRWVRL